MSATLLIGISATIQFITAFLAFRMIKISGHLSGWILISVALFLMGLRRVTTLLGLSVPALASPLRIVGAESIALLISICMLSSVILIRAYFVRQQRQAERLQESEKKYRELSDDLETRVHQRTRQLLDTRSNLQRCSQVQSEFLSKMSHELRTPLNAVIGFSDILLTGVDGELTEEQKKDAQLILKNGHSLLQLIDDILDFSRLDEGKISLASDFIPVEPAIRSALKAHQETIQAKKLSLDLPIPSDVPPVYADPDRLKQILLNLIGNAVKFTHRGRITITAAPADREGRLAAPASGDPGGFLRITVTDTGIGIDKDDLLTVFDGFHQSDSGPSRTYQGTGLGLAIVHGLVELHGGEMGVVSEKAKGSQFWFTLPTFPIKPSSAGQAEDTKAS